VARAELMKITEPKAESVIAETEPVSIERDSLAPPPDEDAISIGEPTLAAGNGLAEQRRMRRW